MTDASDRLAARFAALADPLDDSDWLDVRRRAGSTRGRSRAWLALPLAAVLLALVLGSAFAYYGDMIDFFEAEKAPPETLAFFEHFSVDVPPSFEDPQVIVGETRRFHVPTIDGRSATLFLAPTRIGGFCTLWEAPRHGGGCVPPRSGPLGVGSGAARGHGSWITATVDPEHVARVELRFDDGSMLELPITWISPPIDRGFALYVFRDEERERLESVVGLDEDGELVTQDDLGRPRTVGPPPDAVLDERTAAVEVSSRSGRAVMWLAPTRYGRECVWLDLEERHDPYCSLPFHVRSTPQTVLVYGRVGEDDATIDLRYANGDTDAVRAEDGIFLFEIAEEHLDPGTALQSMRVRSADLDKEPWLSTTLGRGNSCRALPQPAGHSCPFAPGSAD